MIAVWKTLLIWIEIGEENKRGTTLENKVAFKIIGETDFRELFSKVLYIQPTEEVRKTFAKNAGICSGNEGFLAYSHIDDQAGLSFDILCQANIEGGKLTYGGLLKDICWIVRRGYLDGCRFADAEQYGVCRSDFCEEIRQHIHMIDENYECKNTQTKEMRRFAFLDPVRSSDYPDDIQVLLYQEGSRPEMVWVKCYAYTQNELFGLLLNEPNQDFGVHEKDIIGFAPMKTERGMICVYTGKRLGEIG